MKHFSFGSFLLIGMAIAVHGAQPQKIVAKSEESPAKESLAKGETETEGPNASSKKREAEVTSIEPEALEGFEEHPPKIQQLIRSALALTRLNLTYTFGSSDPKNGGMDCSGTIYHLLNGMGVAGVPRQSDQICLWVKEKAALHQIIRAGALTHSEFDALQPGDLLFWSSTYPTGPRPIPVSHVMLYLGKLKAGGKHVVFGASDGRAYAGKRRTGVSVFDFTLPKPANTARFYGYGIVPGIGGSTVKPNEHVIAAAPAAAESEAKPDEEVRRAEVAAVPVPRDQQN